MKEKYEIRYKQIMLTSKDDDYWKNFPSEYSGVRFYNNGVPTIGSDGRPLIDSAMEKWMDDHPFR